jgi:hypothetical protein
VKRTEVDLLVLQAEAARCGMSIEQYITAQQWSLLFTPRPARKRR